MFVKKVLLINTKTQGKINLRKQTLTYIFVSVYLHNNNDLMRRDVFQAIADPNRRAILSMLANNNLNVNQVADNFDITRSAVSQHMKILTECGLVMISKKGRERYCEAKLDKLGEVWNWLNQYKTFWEGKFDEMEIILKEIQAKNKTNGNKK